MSLEDVGRLGDWIHAEFGYDFRGYHPEPLRKSLATILRLEELRGVDHLMRHIAADRTRFAHILSGLTVTSSTMFRNPRVFAALAREVFPYLKTYSSLKIWHAGCSRGEEVYSLAILLKEHGLLERTRIYATDINPVALATARDGIYPARRMKEFMQNYAAAGGAGHLSDYFEMKYGHAKLASDLAARVLFSKHDLVADAPFGEMQLILCRNVLIYFENALQLRTLGLFRESLCAGGFLCLGQSDAVIDSAMKARLKPFVQGEMIFRAAEA